MVDNNYLFPATLQWRISLRPVALSSQAELLCFCLFFFQHFDFSFCLLRFFRRRPMQVEGSNATLRLLSRWDSAVTIMSLKLAPMVFRNSHTPFRVVCRLIDRFLLARRRQASSSIPSVLSMPPRAFFTSGLEKR